MLNTRIVRASVRTAGCRRVQRIPSADVPPHGSASVAALPPVRRQRHRQHQEDAGQTSSVSVAKGQARPAANSAAPIGGPASWLSVRNPVCRRALAMARSSRSTSIGSRVWLVLSANTSLTATSPSPASATRRSASRSAAGRRSRPARRPGRGWRRRRSAGGPSGRRARRRRGRRPAGAPSATGRRATPGTRPSSGWRPAGSPAARAIPSPRFVVQLEASNQRKRGPSRAGTNVSTSGAMASRWYGARRVGPTDSCRGPRSPSAIRIALREPGDRACNCVITRRRP